MGVRFDEHADHFAIALLDGAGAVLVGFPIHKTQPDEEGRIVTTHGPLPVAALDRVVLFEHRPSEFVVAVEWRRGQELVRRDVNVVLKEGSVIADAIASQV